MMTPRSVAIQNKDFMVYLKYGSHKSNLKINKDSSIDQLKQKISEQLNLAESDLNIIINGKSCPARGNLTLSQAKIPNGSKILVTVKQNDNIRKQDNDSAADRIDKILNSIEAKGLEISQKVDELEDTARHLEIHSDKNNESNIQNIKHHKKTAAIQGELLMQHFESIDNLSLSESMTEQKQRRKNVANLLNKVLDRNDQVISILSSHLHTFQQDR